MKHRKIFLFICLLMLTLVWIPVSVQAQDDVQTYTLGVAQPFTGSLGTYGTDFSKGIELAVDQMNAQLSDAGVKIKFVIASQDRRHARRRGEGCTNYRSDDRRTGHCWPTHDG